jgi:hypothetical protein
MQQCSGTISPQLRANKVISMLIETDERKARSLNRFENTSDTQQEYEVKLCRTFVPFVVPDMVVYDIRLGSF